MDKPPDFLLKNINLNSTDVVIWYDETDDLVKDSAQWIQWHTEDWNVRHLIWLAREQGKHDKYIIEGRDNFLKLCRTNKKRKYILRNVKTFQDSYAKCERIIDKMGNTKYHIKFLFAFLSKYEETVKKVYLTQLNESDDPYTTELADELSALDMALKVTI